MIQTCRHLHALPGNRRRLIDTDMRALDPDGKPIEGLFVGGNDSGSFPNNLIHFFFGFIYHLFDT